MNSLLRMSKNQLIFSEKEFQIDAGLTTIFSRFFYIWCETFQFENRPEHWYSECLRACSLLWNRIPFFAKHLGIKTSNSSHSNLPSLNILLRRALVGMITQKIIPRVISQKTLKLLVTWRSSWVIEGHLGSLTEAFWTKTWPDLHYCQEREERYKSAEAFETSESHLLPFHLPFIT